MKLTDDNNIVLKSGDIQEILNCPLCSSNKHFQIGSLDGKHRANNRTVVIPNYSVYLLKCNKCNLLFKNVITTPAAEHALQKYWKGNDNIIKRWDPRSKKGLQEIKHMIDDYALTAFKNIRVKILDVGVGEGGFIKLFHEK